MKTVKTGFLLMIASLVLLSATCKKTGKSQKTSEAFQMITQKFDEGEIEKCSADGKVIYKCQVNQYDSETVLYDADGVLIGTCNYAFGLLHPLCDALESCETIYRVAENIWGKPGIEMKKNAFSKE